MIITRQALRYWGACYEDDKIAELVPPEGVTPLQVCDAGQVPVEDRFWVLLREEIMSERDLRLLACRWAQQACRAAGWDDPRSIGAIATARRYALGEATAEELGAAREAARTAWEAGWAAREAARTAWAAAREAARTAAWAARAAADAAQLADVRAVLAGEGVPS